MPCGLAAWLPGCLVPGWVRCRAGLQRTPLSWPSLPWPSLAYLGLPWPTLAYPGLPWPTLACPGLPWPALACPVLPWPALACLGLPWSALVCLGLPWPASACLGLPWPGLAWPGLLSWGGHPGRARWQRVVATTAPGQPPQAPSSHACMHRLYTVRYIQHTVYSMQQTA